MTLQDLLKKADRIISLIYENRIMADLNIVELKKMAKEKKI